MTPKTMCNHNIPRNEKNRSKLVILQSFSVLCYIFRKWEHFQITKFDRVYMAGGQAQLLAIQVLLIIMRFPLPNFNATDLKFGSSTYLFPALYF